MDLDQLKSLIDQMPQADKRGMYSQIDKDKVEQAAAEVFKAGPEAWAMLIDQVAEPDKGGDYQARYLLHALGLHVSKLKDAEQRKKFTAALCKPLGGDKPKTVQAFLIQEVQYYGAADAMSVLARLLGDEDLCDPAAMAMLAISPDSAALFRQTLPSAKGRCKRMIIQCLGRLKDDAAVGEIQKSASDADVDIRIVAVWALANIGDAGCADLILKAAQTPAGWERVQGAKACLMLAEKLTAAGQKDAAARLTKYLQETRTDRTEKYVADAAGRIR